MAIANTTLQIRKSGITSIKPTTLAVGELAINYADDKLYYKNSVGNISYFYGANNGPGFSTANANNTLLLASTPNDTLSIVAGNNTTITACTTTKTITVNAILDPAFTQANSAFNAANSAASFANSAFIQANNISSYANGQITIIAGVDTTQNTNIASAQSFANGAFTTANNALANTGPLLITNGSAQVLIANTAASTSNTTGALVVSGGLGVSGNVNINQLNVNSTGPVSTVIFPYYNATSNTATPQNVTVDSSLIWNNIVTTTGNSREITSMDYTYINPTANLSQGIYNKTIHTVIAPTNSNNLGAVYSFQPIVTNLGSGNVSSMYANYVTSTHAGSGTVTTMYGTFSSVGISGTGYANTTTAYGYYSTLTNSNVNGSIGTRYGYYSTASNSGTVTNHYNFYATGSNTGTITNYYGLYLNATTGGTITNKYGVYQADATANNYFAGVATLAANPILNGGTTNGLTYLDGSKSLTSGSALTFDGTNLGINTSSVLASTTFTTSTTTANQIIYSMPTATYRSAKLMVQMTSSTSYQVTELLIIHDGTNAFMTQYGDIATTGTSLGTFDSSITSGNLNLLFTPTNAATTVKLSSSLIVL